MNDKQREIFALAGSVMSFNDLYEAIKDLGLDHKGFIHARNCRVLRSRCKAHGIVAVSREGHDHYRVSVRNSCDRERGYFLVW